MNVPSSQPTTCVRLAGLVGLFLILLVPLGLALPRAKDPAGPAVQTSAGRGKVVLLGFDGADARTIRELMERSPEHYPNFRRLQEEGSFESLAVEAPPESPVSWAALNTGQNPAKTGVPGFVRRSIDGGKNPGPALGHLRNETRPLADFDGAPLPNWSPVKMAGIFGGVAFAAAFVLLALLLRRKLGLAVLFALVIGAGGAYAGHTLRGYLPDQYPRTTNPNKAKNLWDFAAAAGARCVVLDAAQAFDMPVTEGARVLAGLGVPDARGAIGDWFIYTSNPAETKREPQGNSTNTAGTMFRVDFADGTIESHVYGPVNFWSQQKLERRKQELEAELKDPALALEKSIKVSEEKSEVDAELKRVKSERTSVPLVVRKNGDKAEITIDGQTQTLGEGQWSEFYELTFKLNPLLSVKALTRVSLIHLDDPYFELFVNVLDIDPRSPPFWQPISQPPAFSADLASSCEMLFETYGWSTATMPFKDEKIAPEVLMQEVEFTLGWQEQLTERALRQGDWDLFMSVISVTDRVQHMMYQFYDEAHPLYDAAAANREMVFFGETIRLADAIPAIYRQMDRVVGDIRTEFIGSQDTLIVCSDHGFQSFRRQVHINNWLAENGYLAIKEGTSKRTAAALTFVDWARTKAYSLGMGFIYLNLRGREPNGIVEPAEADALLAEIREKLLQATDPEHPEERLCKDVYVTKEVHSGPYLDLEADLLLGFAPTYRISWSSTSGGVALQDDGTLAPLCADNDSMWSGDHISVALPDVAGVFFSNRKVVVPPDGVRLLQIAPTALDLLGIAVPPEMDLAPLRFH